MRKAILPILLIMAIALASSVATATDFKASGAVDTANGWTTNVPWENDFVNGERVASYSDGATMVTASHPVVTQASGQFAYTVLFKISDSSNYVKTGLVAGGHEYAIEYKNGKFFFDGQELGANTNAVTNNNLAQIWSDDGIVWHGKVYTYQSDVTVNAVPTSATLALTNTKADYSPVIYGINFDSIGEPAQVTDPTPTPVPEVQPVSTEPVYDVQQVQDYYDNIYPLLYGPQANYGMTATATPAAATSFKVSGAVTSAVDGSPIEGASILLGNAIQKTDSLGKFKFEGIASGVNDISVSADGFASQTQNVNVNADLTQDFALDKMATGGSTVASAANETTNMTTNVTTTTTNTTTNVTTPANTTVAPTTAPSATQTKSPGFEGIIAAIAMIGAAGVLVYANRKH